MHHDSGDVPMKRLPFFAFVLGIAPCLMCGIAAADVTPSVLAKLAPLTKGALPRVITVYGQVDPDSSARHVLIAPLQATVSNVFVRAGESVKEGQKLVELTPSPISVSSYEQAKSAVSVATNLVQRTRSLVASHLATEQELVQAEKDQADARDTFNALNAQGAEGIHDITAPFGAIITQLQAIPGQIVSEGSLLVELAQPNGLAVMAGVVPREALSVDTGDSVMLAPIGGGNPIQGKVVFRGSFVDAGSGLVPVDVSMPQGEALLGEMFRADITVGYIKGYVVPHHAVLVDDTDMPYVVQSDKLIAKKVMVKVLGSASDQDVITGPLDPSLPLVVAGAYQMDDGTHIRVEPRGTADATDPKGN
jgi:membrane fusion protein (multidrug efflux system)